MGEGQSSLPEDFKILLRRKNSSEKKNKRKTNKVQVKKKEDSDGKDLFRLKDSVARFIIAKGLLRVKVKEKLRGGGKGFRQ